MNIVDLLLVVMIAAAVLHGLYVGAAVQLASRLCDRAKAGTVLVSSAVRDLAVGKGFDFQSRGQMRPKGFAESVRIFEVVVTPEAILSEMPEARTPDDPGPLPAGR